MVVMRFGFFFLPALLAITLAAQSPARFVGTVRAAVSTSGEIEIKPDAGDSRTVKLIPESVFQRVAPGAKDLNGAAAIEARDVAVGDRVLVALEPGTDQLRRLVVMPAVDIAKRNEADRLDWQARGVSGVVAAKRGDVITLKVRSLTGEREVTLIAGGKTTYRRYAPDSVKFADAKVSNLAELNIGDQVRARGVKSDDGAKVTAEDVVFGTFVTKAGKVTAVDAGKREIQMVELGSNKLLTVKLSADSQLKKFPNFPGMGGPSAAGGMPPGGPARTGAPVGAMPAGMPALPGSGGPPDLAQMLEHMPTAQLEDLIPGQTIVVSSTKGQSSGEVTAIMLLANAEMLVRMASTQRSRNAGASAVSGSPGMMGGAMSGAGGMPSGMDGLQLPGIVP